MHRTGINLANCSNIDRKRLVIEPEITYTSWTPWTPWTPCSKSCGGGVSTRNQSCLTTNFDGTNQICDRNKVETKRCNTEDCSACK